MDFYISINDVLVGFKILDDLDKGLAIGPSDTILVNIYNRDMGDMDDQGNMREEIN